MDKSFPLIPQTGRQPITLSEQQEKKLLSRRVAADRTDTFATDANEAVRTLGRLALRRDEPDPNDALALGDLCARLSLNGDQLLILYVGKTLASYRRARHQAKGVKEQQFAERAAET